MALVSLPAVCLSSRHQVEDVQQIFVVFREGEKHLFGRVDMDSELTRGHFVSHNLKQKEAPLKWLQVEV